MESSVKETTKFNNRPRWWEPQAAYVHVPFCAHHCCYCDFAVVEGRDQLADRYLDALEREIADCRPAAQTEQGSPAPVETIFIGGGTPTHLSVSQLQRLLTLLRSHFQLAPDYEFSIEANPASLDDCKIDALAQHGVNRVSLGAQAFQTHVLRILERDHDASTVRSAVERIHRRIANVSLDLIFGVPGQTLEQWAADLRQAVELNPSHLSTYGLTYEKGTRLWKDREHGKIIPLDEELERDMYALAMDELAAAGFEHYEISNFARPGFRSRHNQVYWANEAYFGFGLGAARYIHGRREVNTRDLEAYIRKALAGESAVQQSEELSPEERARETAVVQLRRAEGIDRAAYTRQTGFELDALVGPAIEKNRASGLLVDDGVRVCLSREGKFLADGVCSDLL